MYKLYFDPAINIKFLQNLIHLDLLTAIYPYLCEIEST